MLCLNIVLSPHHIVQNHARIRMTLGAVNVDHNLERDLEAWAGTGGGISVVIVKSGFDAACCLL